MKVRKHKCEYHVFTDNTDEYVITKKEAMAIIKKWRGEGAENLRIYQIEVDENQDCTDNESCIYSKGEFPW